MYMYVGTRLKQQSPHYDDLIHVHVHIHVHVLLIVLMRMAYYYE